MNLGQTGHAIDKFESTKTLIENEIVYENPLLFINVCNQLGNCYLSLAINPQKTENRMDLFEKALDNFESSLCLINRMDDKSTDQLINNVLVGKICLNIALIRSQLGNHHESVIMHLKSLDHKREQVANPF